MAYRIARRNHAGRDDPAIDAGATGSDIGLHEGRITHLHRQRVAGRTGAARFEHDLAHMETVPGGNIPVVEAFDDQIFAKCPGRQLVAEFGSPPVQGQRTFEQHRLVLAAVMSGVANGIADQTEPVDHRGRVQGALVDAGLETLARQLFGAAETDGEKFHADVPSAIPFEEHMG